MSNTTEPRRPTTNAEAPDDDELVVCRHALPGGQRWVLHEDLGVLEISPEVDEAIAARLIAQVTPPRLTKCDTCGASMYEGTRCGLCRWDALPEGPPV